MVQGPGRQHAEHHAVLRRACCTASARGRSRPRAERRDAASSAHDDRDVEARGVARARDLVLGVEIGLRRADGPCQRLPLVEHAMLQDGEGHAGVAGGVRDGRELFRVAEPFGSLRHPGAAIEHRLQLLLQRRLGRRQHRDDIRRNRRLLRVSRGDRALRRRASWLRGLGRW